MLAGWGLGAGRTDLALGRPWVVVVGMGVFVEWGRVVGTLAGDVVTFEGGGVVAEMGAAAVVVCR